MNKKLVYRILFLAFFLVLVVVAMNFTASGGFKAGINDVFSVETKIMKWCPDHLVDFQWIETNINQNKLFQWSQAKPAEIRKVFCAIEMEATGDVNLAKVVFKPLLLAQSAEAKSALLEWSLESKVFQVQGVPFKSTRLFRELVDETK